MANARAEQVACNAALRALRTLNVETVVDPDMTFEPKALKAVKALARTKPWQGTFNERLKNFKLCAKALAECYELGDVAVRHVGVQSGCSGQSDISPDGRIITLKGRLSVVTMLHLMAKSRAIISGGERMTVKAHLRVVKWSVNLFKRCYPISYSRCVLVDGLLVNEGRRDG